MHTIQEVSQNTLKLEGIFSAAAPGEFFSYSQLQQISGIRMDSRGKSYIKGAFRRLKTPYETIRGQGVKILSKDNATRIVIRDVVKIDNSIKRAEKTTRQVKNIVYDQLPEEERRNINFLGALFGTIRSYSQSAKRIFHHDAHKIGDKIK